MQLFQFSLLLIDEISLRFFDYWEFHATEHGNAEGLRKKNELPIGHGDSGHLKSLLGFKNVYLVLSKKSHVKRTYLFTVRLKVL